MLLGQIGQGFISEKTFSKIDNYTLSLGFSVGLINLGTGINDNLSETNNQCEDKDISRMIRP